MTINHKCDLFIYFFIHLFRRMYRLLTLRECEYLEYIRRKNMPLYGAIIRKLKEDRYDSLVNNETKPIYNGDGANSYEMN